MRYLSTALLGCLLTSGASAQDYGYDPDFGGGFEYGTAAGIGLTRFDDGSESATGYSLDTDTRLGFGRLSADIGLGFTTLSEGSGSVSTRDVSIAPHYDVNGALGFGAYVTRRSIDADVGDIANVDSYGAEVTLTGSRLTSAAFIGATDLDELSGVVDVQDYGLRFDGTVSDRVTVFGSGVWSDVEGTGSSVDARVLGLGAGYAFDNGLGAFASYQHGDVDAGSLEIGALSLGVTYETAVSNRPVVFSAELSDVNGDAGGASADATRISVGATVLLGNRSGSDLPRHTLSSQAQRGDRNALTGTLGLLGF